MATVTSSLDSITFKDAFKAGTDGICYQVGQNMHIVTVRGERRYLCCAVDQESLPHERSERFGYGDVLDILVENHKKKQAARRFFK